MHEMAIIDNVVQVACAEAEAADAKRVVAIKLRVGEIRDFHDGWVQHFFGFLSKGTLAEGATLEIVRTPVRFRCEECGATYGYDYRNFRMLTIEGEPLTPLAPNANEAASEEKPHCPDHPSAAVHLVSGNEVVIENLEVE